MYERFGQNVYIFFTSYEWTVLIGVVMVLSGRGGYGGSEMS